MYNKYSDLIGGMWGTSKKLNSFISVSRKLVLNSFISVSRKLVLNSFISVSRELVLNSFISVSRQLVLNSFISVSRELILKLLNIYICLGLHLYLKSEKPTEYKYVIVYFRRVITCPVV
jgi:hypothetical protein